MAKNYQGTSITDFLKSTGVASDFSSRATLAQQQGITGYTGSSNQNTQLLGLLNSGNLPPKTITTDALGTQPKIVLPGATNPINPLLGTIAGQVEGAVSGLAQIEADRLSADKNKQEGGISDLIKEMGIISGSEKTIAAGLGAETAQLEINRLSKDLIGEQRAFELQKRDIEARNPGGLFGGAQKDLINNLERASLQKQADIAILKAGAQGDYETANKIAKDRVDAEIAPMQAELDAKKFIYDNNKDLFSAAQKNKLETLQKADQAKLDEERKKKETATSMIATAGMYGASSKEIMEAQDLYNKGGTLPEIAKLVGKYSPDYLDYKIKKATLNKMGQDAEKSRLENQKTRNAIKAAENGTGVSFANLTENQQDTTLKLRDKYNAESKDFVVIRDAYNRIQASASDPSAAGDLALIFNYMKVLDPGSTVREGEFATAQNSAGMPDILRAKYNKVRTGERLAEGQRTDFVARSNKLFLAQQSQQQVINDNYDMLSTSAAIPKEFVTRDISSAVTTETESLNNAWNATAGVQATSTAKLDNWITNIFKPKI